MIYIEYFKFKEVKKMNEIKRVLKDFKMISCEEIDEYGDYVVTVSHNDDKFDVVCQYDEDNNGKLVDYITCINENEGGYNDSELSEFVKAIASKNNVCEHKLEEILIENIDNYANKNLEVLSNEEYISKIMGFDVKEDLDFDSVIYNNVSIKKFKAIESNKLVIVSYDDSHNRAQDSINGVVIFSAYEEYKDFYESTYSENNSLITFQNRIEYIDENSVI